MLTSNNRECVVRSIVGLAASTLLTACTTFKVESDSCRPVDIVATLQTPIAYHGPGGRSVEPTCTVDRNGVVTVRYMPLACEDSAQSWWAGCIFAANQDLSDFDAEVGGSHGVLAVKLCVDGFVPSALNLRYGSPGFSADGRTKYMPLISGIERFTGTGCKLVYLSPSDACYSFDRCGAQSGCAPAGGSGPGCDTFGRSELIIMNEFCAASTTVPTAPTVLTIERVTYFPDRCTCNDTDDCTAPRVCRRDGWKPDAPCEVTSGEPCPGVCAP